MGNEQGRGSGEKIPVFFKEIQNLTISLRGEQAKIK
jgi:hypothetical protein